MAHILAVMLRYDTPDRQIMVIEACWRRVDGGECLD